MCHVQKEIYYSRVNKDKNKSSILMRVSKAHSFSDLFLKRKSVVDFHFSFFSFEKQLGKRSQNVLQYAQR